MQFQSLIFILYNVILKAILGFYDYLFILAQFPTFFLNEFIYIDFEYLKLINDNY